MSGANVGPYSPMSSARKLSLWAAGSNSNGQLGIGSVEDSHDFVPCTFSAPSLYGGAESCLPAATRRVRQIATGSCHTLFLAEYDDDGISKPVLYASGSNERGQLPVVPRNDGDESTNRLHFHVIDRVTIHPTSSSHSLDAIAAAWETTFLYFCPTPGLSDVKAPPYFVLSSGANDWGERGSSELDSDYPPDPSGEWPRHNISLPLDGITGLSIKKIATGPRHAIALVERVDEVMLYGWGAARKGQLGLVSSSAGEVTPGKAPKPSPLRSLNTPTPISLPAFVIDTHRIVDVALGKDHSAILLRPSSTAYDDRIVVLGDNKKGQLGPNAVPPNIGVVSADLFIEPVDVEGRGTSNRSNARKTIRSIHTTWNSIFALCEIPSPRSRGSPDTELWAWGSNASGQLGTGQTSDATPRPPTVQSNPRKVQLPPDAEILKVATGSEHVLVLVEKTGTKEKEVWAWGWNEHGNLGLGDGHGLADVWAPTRVWPRRGENREGAAAVDLFAGNATSWILTESEADPSDH